MTSRILLTERAGHACVCKGSTHTSRVLWAEYPEQNQSVIRSIGSSCVVVRSSCSFADPLSQLSQLSR